MSNNKAAREAGNTTPIVSYYKTKLPLDSLFIHIKQKIKHHWNNEWKIIVKPLLLIIKNDFYNNVIPPILKRRDQVVLISNHYRTYENNTNLYSPKETNHSAIGEKDPNNRTPHTITRSTSKKATLIKSTLKNNLKDSGTSSSLLQHLNHTLLYV